MPGTDIGYAATREGSQESIGGEGGAEEEAERGGGGEGEEGEGKREEEGETSGGSGLYELGDFGLLREDLEILSYRRAGTRTSNVGKDGQ
eukprot:1450378-Rhodomonas_salina.2